MLSKGRLLILGDFNIHVDIPNLPDTEKFVKLLDTFGLMQHVSLPTHRLGHTLDLVITRSNDNLISDLVVNNPLVSDHHVVHFDILTSKPSLPKKSISHRCFKKLDLSAFKKDVIESELWSQISTDPNDLVSSYNSVLQSLLDKHVPIKERMITVSPLSPWYSSEIQNLHSRKKKI